MLIPFLNLFLIITTMNFFKNLYFILFLLVFFSKSIISQNVVLAKKIGGTSSESGNKIAVDDSDNVYVCGFFSGTCNFSSTVSKTSNGGTDVFLAKYDCGGVLQWVQTYCGTNNENNAFKY